MRTPICEQLGIEFPIFAFSHCRDVVAAVTNAGGFGVLGALAYEPERLEIELSWIEEHVHGRPYGVDFAMPVKYIGKGGGADASPKYLQSLIPEEHRSFVDELLTNAGIPALPDDDDSVPKAAGLNVDEEGPGQIEVTLSKPNVKMVVNTLGPPPQYIVEQCHDAGILVGGLVGSRRTRNGRCRAAPMCWSRRAPKPAGTAARSRRWCSCRRWSTQSVPMCRCSPRAGFTTAGRWPRPWRSARRACGPVRCGCSLPRPTCTRRSPRTSSPRRSPDAIRSRVMTGKPARQLRTKWTEAWDQPGAPDTLPMPLQGLLFNEASRRIRVHNKEFGGYPVGQVIGSIDHVRPSKDLVLEMVEQWIETVGGLNELMSE